MYSALKGIAYPLHQSLASAYMTDVILPKGEVL